MIPKLRAVIYNDAKQFLALTDENNKRLYLPGSDTISGDRTEVSLNNGLIELLGFGLNKLVKLPIPTFRGLGTHGNTYIYTYYHIKPRCAFNQNKEANVSVQWLTVDSYNSKVINGYKPESLLPDAFEHANKIRLALMRAVPCTRTKFIKG